MSFLSRVAMRKTLQHYLKMGEHGLSKHEPDVVCLLQELTEEQLSLYQRVLERTLTLARAEWARR